MAQTSQMTLNDMIDKNRVLAFNCPDREFWLFMEDHRDFLLSTASKNYLTYDEQELYRYRPIEYLLTLAYSIHAARYILWLNQIKSIMEFDNIKYLYIPNEKIITDVLYMKYRSEKSGLKGNESKFFED